MKKTGLYESIFDFTVDYRVTAVDNILDIHKYLMKKWHTISGRILDHYCMRLSHAIGCPKLSIQKNRKIVVFAETFVLFKKAVFLFTFKNIIFIYSSF